jgi:hypothetical protein
VAALLALASLWAVVAGQWGKWYPDRLQAAAGAAWCVMGVAALWSASLVSPTGVLWRGRPRTARWVGVCAAVLGVALIAYRADEVRAVIRQWYDDSDRIGEEADRKAPETGGSKARPPPEAAGAGQRR